MEGQWSDRDFFFGYVARYLDGYLTGAEFTRMETILKSGEYVSLLDQFKSVRGALQSQFSEIRVSANQMDLLRHLADDDEHRTRAELTRIDTIEKKEKAWDFLRRFAFGAVMGGLCVWVFLFLQNKKGTNFHILDSIGYETLAFDEEPSRVDLPTDDEKDIEQFLKTAAAALKFKAFLLTDLPEEWQVDGISLIDYDSKKMICVRYKSKSRGDTFYHYTTDGSFQDLPRAEKAHVGHFDYMTHASDKLNFITYEKYDGTLSIIVGRRSAPELAQLIR